MISQYLISLTAIGLISISSYPFADIIGYKVVALLLLLLVSILAMLFDVLPVVVAAILSALTWNFLFIPPTFTFAIHSAEDTLLFLMYFAIATINAVLTIKIRDFQEKAKEREEKAKAIDLYNTLLNSLSHELRTPISTIIGASDTLREGHKKLSPEHREELLNEIEIAGFRLNQQVENLLNMSRLEAKVLQPNPDWCDVNELVYSVIVGTKDKDTSRAIIFKMDETLPLFRMDRGIVEQILINLLRNALKYTPESSPIVIEVVHSNENCIFRISDSGPGIPEGELDTIFDKFYRIPRNLTGGTGLGLSIAKGFAEALGGSIHASNKKEGGAVFIVSIPSKSSPINRINHE